MAEHSDKMLDHDYDGIKELDNDLPRWWLWLFYFTIIFGVLYFLYYDVLGIGYTSADAYRSEMDPAFVRAEDRTPTYFGVLPKYVAPFSRPELEQDDQPRIRPVVVRLTHETDTNTYVANMEPASLSAGKEIFLTKCASCHGVLGEGGVGPNLTDDYWIHGNSYTNIVKTVRYGYPAKGMIAWLGQLTQDQIIEVASFVTTLHGTNPPNQKAPEGELVSSW